MTHRLLILALGILIAGCGNDTAKEEQFTCSGPRAAVACIDMMKGKMYGRSWKFSYGTAVQPAGSETWMVHLYEGSPGEDACATKPSELGKPSYQVRFHVRELKTGELDYQLGSGKGAVSLEKNTKTKDGAQGEAIAAFGKGSINSVGEKFFSGQLEATDGGENSVKGQFVVKLCR